MTEPSVASSGEIEVPQSHADYQENATSTVLAATADESLFVPAEPVAVNPLDVWDAYFWDSMLDDIDDYDCGIVGEYEGNL